MQCQHRQVGFVARLPVSIELPKAVDGVILGAPKLDSHRLHFKLSNLHLSVPHLSDKNGPALAYGFPVLTLLFNFIATRVAGSLFTPVSFGSAGTTPRAWEH